MWHCYWEWGMELMECNVAVIGSGEWKWWNVMWHCYCERGMELMECNVALLLGAGNVLMECNVALLLGMGNGTDGM